LATKQIHRKLTVLLFLIAALTLSATAQKKKKTSGDATASGMKLREAEFYFTEGEKYFILEDYAKALLYYQRTIEINPENPTVHYKIAEVLARSNKQEDLLKASLSIDQAIRLDKSNKYFYILAASIYSSMARFDKAASAYETMLKEIPGTEEYLYELAAIYQYANKQEEAIRIYTKAEGVFGINEISSTQKIRLYLEAGKSKEAIAEGEKLMNAFPEEERYVMAFAQVLSQKNLNVLAIQYLEKYTQQTQDAGNAKMLLAGLYRDTNQESKARPLLLTLFDDSSVEYGSKLIVLGAYSSELSQGKTRNAVDTDKEAFALQLFEKLKKNYPQEPSVHIIGGDLLLIGGKDREAQKEYTQAVESGEVNFEVWENLLYLDIKLEQFDQALKHSDQALEIFPNQAMIHYFNGFANLRKRRYQEAIAAFEQCRKLAGNNQALTGDVYAMLGDAYNANKEFEKSDKAYDDALMINPNNNSVLNNYSFYLALRKANLEKAEKMSTLLVKNNPDNPSYLDTHAWVLYTRTKYKEARRIIERAISTGKASAVHFEHYGDILYKLGDIDGAVQQWEKARGLNANSETLNKKIANRKIYE
jgi:tetratricopeptide (TPR) repeat protein